MIEMELPNGTCSLIMYFRMYSPIFSYLFKENGLIPREMTVAIKLNSNNKLEGIHILTSFVGGNNNHLTTTKLPL